LSDNSKSVRTRKTGRKWRKWPSVNKWLANGNNETHFAILPDVPSNDAANREPNQLQQLKLNRKSKIIQFKLSSQMNPN